jgi:DNA repair exonuclease SbcCD ATPase subunit
MKGFGSYRDLTTIAIPNGLVGIVGAYEQNSIKSVGAGKTTIISALLYAFFGKGEFDKVEEVVNDQLNSKDSFFVKVRFSLNKSNFEVERGKNPNTYLEFKENGISRGDPKIDSRNEEIKKVLGMDYDMFTASIFFEQDRLSKLVDTDPSTRRNYIEKVLGTHIWTIAGKEISKDKNILKKDLEILNKELDTLITLILSYEEQLKRLEQIEVTILETNSRKKEIELEIKKYSTLKQDSLELERLQDSKVLLQSNLDSTKEKLSSLLDGFNKDTKNLELVKDSLKSDKLLLEGVLKELEILNTSFLDMNSNLENIFKKEMALTIHLSSYQQEKKNIEEARDRIQEGECATCGTKITEEFKKKRELELLVKLNTIELDISSLLSDKISLERNKKDIEIAKKELSKKLQDATQESDSIKRSIELNERSILTLESKINGNLFKDLEKSYQDSIFTTSKEIKEIDSKVSYLKEKIKDFSISNLETLKDTLKSYEESIIQLNQEKGILKGIQLELDKRILDKNSKLEEIKDKEYQLSIQKILEEEFDKIPSELLTSSVSYIEKESSAIIHSFMPEMDVFVREDLTKITKPLQVTFTVAGKRRSYKRLSGGQRTIANLALRLGFSKVISSRVGVSLNFLILDEPFAFLDNHNRDIVKKVLMELKKSFSQIIVISHVDNIQDFPNLIKVTMCEDGVSRMLEV